MDKARVSKIISFSLDKVKEYLSLSKPGRAFAHYLLYLELAVDERPKHEKSFTHVLSKWIQVLSERNRHNDIKKCFSQAQHYFPSSYEILKCYGNYYLSIGDDFMANHYLDKAHALNQNDTELEYNLDTTKVNLIDRWHFKMINDIIRNQAYHDAILGVGNRFKCDKVLDIGTGTGLLSLYASKCKYVKEIVALESNKALFDIATKVFLRHQIAAKLNLSVINKSSLDVTMSVPANLLCTEIFDAALFGEGALRTLIHAHENLLCPGAKFIPNSAVLYVTAIECEEILKKYKVTKRPGGLLNLNLDDICAHAIKEEPYDAEKLKWFKYKKLSDPQEFLHVDFTNLDLLKRIYDGKEQNEIEIKFTTSGTVHCFAVWFKLILDEYIQIDTGPDSDIECWEQAIFFVQHSRFKMKGDTMKLKIGYVRDVLHLNFSHLTLSSNCYELTTDAVRFLNDFNLYEFINSTEGHFSQRCTDVVDFFPIPLFGIYLLLKFKYSAETTARINILSINGKENMKYIECICRKNGIDFSRIRFLDERELPGYLFEVQPKFDYVIIDPICSNGQINYVNTSWASVLEKYLKPNGTIEPKVCLEMIGMKSKTLKQCSEVYNEYTIGFNIATDLNKFRVSEFWALDNLPYNVNRSAEYSNQYKSIFCEGKLQYFTSDIEVGVCSDAVLKSYLLVFFQRFNFSALPKCSFSRGDGESNCYYKLTSYLLPSGRNVNAPYLSVRIIHENNVLTMNLIE